MALPIPSEIQVDKKNFRYLSFKKDGVDFEQRTTLDFSLIMSGNTPITVRKPRRSTVKIDEMHGSIDISWQTGEIHYEDRELTYNFAYCIPINGYNRDELNSKSEAILQEITTWINMYDDGNMYDSGAGNFKNVRLTNAKAEKSFSSNYWILAITLQFKAHPIIEIGTRDTFPCRRIATEVSPAAYAYVEQDGKQILVTTDTTMFTGRTFSFGGQHVFYSYNLYVSGNVELAPLNMKRSSITIPFADGTANMETYYDDSEITYNCVGIIPVSGTTNEMNQKCQYAVEKVSDWLYGYSGSDSYKGITMKGTGVIVDSALGEFRLARCTGLTVTKTISIEYWLLAFEIKFTTYPKIQKLMG